MANLYGANYNAAYNATKSPKNYPPGQFNGEPRVIKDTFTGADGANVIAIGDKIFVGKLPKGAVILDAIVNIPATLGTGGIFTLGTAADEDGIISGTGLDAGGQAAFARANGVLVGTQLDAETDVFLIATEATSAAAAKKIHTSISYLLV